jgi:DNA-binding NarL/FixJ family response regulator
VSKSYEKIRVVIADPNHMIRVGLKAALHSFGFRTITDVGQFVRVHDLLEQDAVDLLITANEIETNNVGFLVEEMRNQRLGNNPFVVVVALLASAETETVRKVIDAGVDDLLLMPVSPEQLFSRIDKMAHKRKPFVITHDYTGPDRRTKARAFTGQAAPSVEPPNVLKIRMQNGIDSTRLNQMVKDASVTLNKLKIERYMVQLQWLINHVHASIRDGVAQPAELAPDISRLAATTGNMINRMRGTAYEGAIAAVGQVLDLAGRIEANPDALSFPELDRLHQLIQHAARSFGGPAPAAPAC